MFYLMLEGGLYVTYEQISENEVEVIPVTISDAHIFKTLEEAREAAKGVNNNHDEGFTLYSEGKVISIVKIFSVE